VFGEMLEVDMPDGRALAVFTSERRAEQYAWAAGIPTEGPDGWSLCTLPRHVAEDHIRDDAESKHAVFDPLPDGKRGRRLTVFQALVELG
jgi:hypothetical protein